LLNLIHFNTNQEDELLNDLETIQDRAGPNCHGFQLNLAWPDPRVLERYKRLRFARKTIVLQCGNKALDAVKNDAARLAQKLHEYEGLVEYVLIDPSAGKGQDFNLTFAKQCLWALEKSGPESMGLGIAGGLHAHNLGRLQKLVSEHELSIDAEGKLRDKDDNLSVAAARAYVAIADALFRQNKKVPA
jgi:hypothetical protein